MNCHNVCFFRPVPLNVCLFRASLKEFFVDGSTKIQNLSKLVLLIELRTIIQCKNTVKEERRYHRKVSFNFKINTIMKLTFGDVFRDVNAARQENNKLVLLNVSLCSTVCQTYDENQIIVYMVVGFLLFISYPYFFTEF